MKSYTINPLPHSKIPYMWSLRDNWDVENGLWYDTMSGALYMLTDNPYTSYIGRIPVTETQQMELV